MSPTVLVADDSRTIRKVVEWALKGSAFEVVGVGSAQETMEAAKQQPSVILLDYHMPDGSGYEVCRALKDGPTSKIPVVMLGGSYHGFDEDQARQAGADEVVMKPFKTDDIVDAIDQVSNAAADAAAASELGGQAPESAGPGAPPPKPSGGGASQPAQGSTQQPSGGGAGGAAGGGAPTGGGATVQGTPAGTPAGGSETPGSAPSRHPSGSGGGSKPRMRMEDSSGPKSPPPRRGGSSGGSQPRMRTPSGGGSGAGQAPSGGDGGSDSRMPSGRDRPQPGSQPRIPDSGTQPRAGSTPGSKASQPDINASTREQQVSSSGSGASSAPAAGAGDSGVSSIGASRAEIENMVNETVRRSVKEQLPGLLRNIMGEVFQKKVLPKLLEHGQQRVEALVQDELDERIRVCVREEIERLLAEE